LSSFVNRQTGYRMAFFCLIPAICLASCQTTRRWHEPISMPVIMQPQFGACSPSEDEASLEIEKNGTRVFSANMVWSFNDGQDSSVQINSPFGDTIMEMRANAGRWSTSGQVQVNLAESRNGFLTIENYDVPVKSPELGCILGGVWPVEWLRWLEISKDDPKMFRLEGNDGLRTLRIDMNSSELSRHGHSGCAFFTWGGFLGFFQRRVTLCREKMKNGTMLRLTGINNYLVNWTLNNGD